MALIINPEAEQSAIITILNNPEMAGRILGHVDVDHFGEDAAIEVVARITALTNASKQIPKRQVFMVDGALSDDARQYLENIQFKALKHQEDVDALIGTLQFHRKMRLLSDGMAELKEQMKKVAPEQFYKLVSRVDSLAMELKSESQMKPLMTFGKGDHTQTDKVEEAVLTGNQSSRIFTGFPYFDDQCGGFRRKQAVLLAGPTNGGKSALANQLLLNMYTGPQHLKVMLATFEMGDEEIYGRLMSNYADIPFDLIEKGKIQGEPVLAQKLKDKRKEFDELGEKNDNWFHVWAIDQDLTAANVIAYCRPMKPDVIVVDYVGLLASEDGKDEERITLSKAMRAFKIAASALDCCIISLAQFDQAQQVVRYARALKEHASVMWAWMYGEQEMATGIVTIRQDEPFGKNRNSKRINFRLQYQLDRMRIVDWGPADVDAPVDDEAPQNNKGKRKPPGQNGVKSRPIGKTSVPKTTPGLSPE